MCIPLKVPESAPQMAPQAPTPPVISDSEVSPDGGKPLLINQANLRPDPPPGYMARFIDGQWMFVQDPKFAGMTGSGALNPAGSWGIRPGGSKASIGPAQSKGG